MSATTPGPSTPVDESAPPSTFMRKWIWVLAAAVGVFSLTLLKVCQQRTLQRLPVLYALPDFNLVDQDGKPFGSDQLDGKVWIASFAFTSCKVECPAIGRANQELQQKLAGTPVQLVTISVDPEFDTPEVLTAWGKTFGADSQRWHLLTGTRKAVEWVVMGDAEHPGGFRTHMGERSEANGLVQIAHSMKLVLVDQFGGIRHYFDATDEKALALIVDHAKALVTEGAAR